MTTPFTRGMAEATALTRAGKLGAATALIRSLLRPAGGEAAAPDDGAVIDGTCTRIGDGNAAQSEARRTAPHQAPHKAPHQAPQKAPHKAPQKAPRNGLAETLRGIAAGGMPARGPLAPAGPAVPAGAAFLTLAHVGPEGRRDYRLYVPANRGAAPMPLVVMLHGCTQTPEDFAIGTGMNALAEAAGFLVAWPAQPQGANAQKCWNWFRPGDQTRGAGEPALIAGILRDVLRDHGGDRRRVYVAGLSAGGAAAAIMGAAYPDLVAAVGVHSGLPVGGARDIPSAFAAMRSGAGATAQRIAVPAIVFHGLADTTVHPGNGAAVIAQAVAAQAGLTEALVSGRAAGGRPYRLTRHADAAGRTVAEFWEIDGAGHAWAGGHPAGSFTDPGGPDASREMLRFFSQHRLA